MSNSCPEECTGEFSPLALVDLARRLFGEGNAGRAEETLCLAIKKAPDLVQAHILASQFAFRRWRPREALAAGLRAVNLDPKNVQAHLSVGMAWEVAGDISRALKAYQLAEDLDKDDLSVLGKLLVNRLMIGDWTRFQELWGRIHEAMLKNGKYGLPLLYLMTISDNPAEQIECAKWMASKLARDIQPLPARSPSPRKKIRIGYLSNKFRDHPGATLAVELFERHDRNYFETFGYSIGPDDGSPLRARLELAFDHFIELGHHPYKEAAQLIRNDGIDILIDLSGYTHYQRHQILAYRPSPIQVCFLGFAASSGAEFIDYLIADHFVIPKDQQVFYSEQIIYLPDCFQCNDTKRQIASYAPTRAACGLPEDGFVFTNFNSSHKILPNVFDCWMRILTAVPGSVLWLLESNLSISANLRREATARGVEADRLVFGNRLPRPEYLARYRLADLFLDTRPYTAHATASDALWAGLPILTCTGTTFASRVAGSLLQAVGLPELVTHSLEDYEALAIKLALEPELLLRLRQRLAAHRDEAPLFDIKRFTFNIESAYHRMFDLCISGAPPTTFSV
ncbi:MAG: glycosyltransferase [Deltaproteobacteria bacterium]|nr:glycosyltransferase [Deltaproteobacteria bacterium]